MSVINETSQRSGMTPPVECSSRNSMTGSREGSGRRKTPVDSLELLHRATGADNIQPKRGSLGMFMLINDTLTTKTGYRE